ncbi:MAG: 4a-hydroxytetrahydrobiopterin dehydratase [Candidatus Dadabacteria bacterium]|nr:4a-hydroxytetrahydrobiopterin dehydratase [Candidatus Dadabacteria bacterium]MCY4262067.1 4a-hydroxytetrahydrobiopterin dehydratase [Candidatus Dadabacteria bacterium]
MALLTEKEISSALKSLDGWQGGKAEIEKTFVLRNFVDSMGFVNKVALLSEKVDHHPDILIRWNNVFITLSTHSEGGVTEKDLNLAREIEKAL